MNEMTARVADAVLADLRGRRVIGDELDGLAADKAVYEDIREAIGRAAIKAMRVPTAEMLQPLTRPLLSCGYGHDDADFDAVWKAMIDGALE